MHLPWLLHACARPLARAALIVCALAPGAWAQVPPTTPAPGRGAIEGLVADSAGAPILGATVEVAGAAPLRTNAQGRFTVRGLAAGSATVFVRRLGYEPARVTTVVPAEGAARLTVRMTPTATTLAAVRVSARREAFEGRLAGFHARRQRGGGHYISRERIEQANSRSVLDLLRGTAGLQMVRTSRSGPGTGVRFRGAGCPPLLFIDGVPATAGEFDLNIIDLWTVEGIEMYPSLSSTPPEFLGPRGLDRCGVIAIWSRPYRPRQSQRRIVEARALVERGEVYPADSVDVKAVLQENTAAPVYPDSLWRAGAAGQVVAEFVVDTTGAVEMGTVVIISATAPAFAAAVRDALETAEFAPAQRRGRAVRQVVHQPFQFVPSGGNPVGGAGRRPPAGAGAPAGSAGRNPG